MSEYPNLKRFTRWLVSQAIPAVILGALIYALGFTNGHESGRTEMKCAIFAIVERLGVEEPAPGTITLGCDKRPTRARETGSAGV